MVQESEKSLAIYYSWDPTDINIAYIAIQTATEPPYVFRTYHSEKDVKCMPNDIAVLSADFVRKVSRFEKGNIDEICK